MPLSPLAEKLVYLYTLSTLTSFLPKSASYLPKTNKQTNKQPDCPLNPPSCFLYITVTSKVTSLYKLDSCISVQVKKRFSNSCCNICTKLKIKNRPKKGEKMAVGDFAPSTLLGRLAAEKFPPAPLRPHGDPRWRRFVFLSFGRLFGVD